MSLQKIKEVNNELKKIKIRANELIKFFERKSMEIITSLE